MSFRGRVFTGSLAYPSDAGRFIAIARNLGGSFTTAQRRALGYLTNGLADLGIGAPGSNWVIYPFIGGSSSAVNALNLFYPETTAYNLTFVGSPTHNTSGVTFDGLTQYAYGQSLSPYPLSPNLTMANISIGVGVTGMGAGTYVPMGFYMAAAVQTKTYSVAGSFSFDFNVEAPGMTGFSIVSWGGGGAGGGATSGVSAYPGGGGGGGNYATSTVTLSGTQLNTPLSITVGAAGTPSAGNNGGNGGDSTVTHPNITPSITAKGGLGGNRNAAGAGGAAVAAQAGNTGSTTFNGGAGGAGGGTTGRGGAGGGSSAGTGTNGNAGSTAVNTTGGGGGTAPTGGVAGGAGGNASNGAGVSGTSPGGGGGGASSAVGAVVAGGAGGSGRVTVAWTPPVFKRLSMSIFNSNPTNNNIFQADVTTDATSRFSYQTTPNLLNGIRVGSRRANTGTATDMAFYVQNNLGGAINGPVSMVTSSFSPSPVFYFGAINNWAPSSGAGNTAGTLLAGTLNFAFMGPGLTNTQLQSLYTLITTYNIILGR